MSLKFTWIAAVFPAFVWADVPVYGQCGGTEYTGSTVCTTGATCTPYNAYYYQCVPGTLSADGITSTSAIATTLISQSSPTTAATTASQTSSIGSITSPSPSSTATEVQYLITFGDSYSQTGFDVNSTKPSADNPLGNPPLPGWTASGGLNWVGFLVSEFNDSTLLSYNFAYGGATTDSDLVTPYDPSVLSFVDQVTEFSESIASHPSYAPWTAENTLVGVWIGVNDVGNIYWLSNVTDVLNAVISRYFEELQIIYDAGARNFFILSCPPINETPSMLLQSEDVRDQEASIITKYNDMLASGLTNFTSVNNGVTAKLIDTSIAFQTAIDDPTAYGAPNATCYNSDGTSCLWYNDYHPGVAINELVANEIATAWVGIFF